MRMMGTGHREGGQVGSQEVRRTTARTPRGEAGDDPWSARLQLTHGGTERSRVRGAVRYDTRVARRELVLA